MGARAFFSHGQADGAVSFLPLVPKAIGRRHPAASRLVRRCGSLRAHHPVCRSRLLCSSRCLPHHGDCDLLTFAARQMSQA